MFVRLHRFSIHNVLRDFTRKRAAVSVLFLTVIPWTACVQRSDWLEAVLQGLPTHQRTCCPSSPGILSCYSQLQTSEGVTRLINFSVIGPELTGVTQLTFTALILKKRENMELRLNYTTATAIGHGVASTDSFWFSWPRVVHHAGSDYLCS